MIVIVMFLLQLVFVSSTEYSQSITRGLCFDESFDERIITLVASSIFLCSRRG